MATFYLDPVGGNDANDGLSFANRWKTFTSGATSARVAAGDTIRVIESPAAVNLGAAAWTNGSTVVTPASPVNKLIDVMDGTGWLGVTNVTVSSASSTSTAKTQTNYLQASFASAFTTGKFCYKDLGSAVDLSAFQQISFWFSASSAATVINLVVDLCSDAAGDTPIVSLTVPTHNQNSAAEYRAVVLDNGAPLPNNVRSIAFRVTTDPATLTFRFENLVACKAPGAQELTHNSIFGKKTVGEPWWYTVHKITDTTVELGGGSMSLYSADPPKPFRGASETADLWVINPTQIELNARTFARSGTSAAPVTISGGWDSTDMSTQSGETWWGGSYFLTSPIVASGTIRFIHVDNIGIVGFRSGWGAMTEGWEVRLLGVLGCFYMFSSAAAGPVFGRMLLEIGQVWGLAGPMLFGSADAVDIKIGIFHGGTETSTNPAKFSATGSFRTGNGVPSTIQVDLISNNSGALFEVTDNPLYVYNTVTDSLNSVDIFISGAGERKELQFVNCTLGAAAKFNAALSTSADSFLIGETNIGGDPRAHRYYQTGAFIETVTDEVHTPGGVSWKMQMLLNARHEQAPAKFPIAQVAVVANKLVTVKCWCRKNHANIGGGLMIDGYWPGLTRTQVPMSATLDTWEEITLTFTPTVAGVIPIYAYGVGDINHRILFGDLTITQAD